MNVEPTDKADIAEKNLFLGIDYGTKRIGVAISDASWKIAFPLTTIETGPSNSEKDGALREIRKICDEHNILTVVIGESKNFKNEDNMVMDDIRIFQEHLEEEFGLDTVFEPEMLSTLQASRIQGEHSKIDASAAAVILQGYLDRINSDELGPTLLDENGDSM